MMSLLAGFDVEVDIKGDQQAKTVRFSPFQPMRAGAWEKGVRTRANRWT